MRIPKALMAVRFLVNPSSGNKTTGPIVVSKSDKSTCPWTCPLRKHGCYAESGPVVMHWNNLVNTGVDFVKFVRQIRQLTNGFFFRLSEEGDLPGNGKSGRLYKSMCLPLAKACRHLKAWTYTHYRPTKHNEPILREMNETMNVNLSANTMQTADDYFAKGFDVCLSVPKDFPMIGSKSPNGVQLVACPNKMGKVENCMKCGNGDPLCHRKNRKYIILFPAHKATRLVAAVFDGFKLQ